MKKWKKGKPLLNRELDDLPDGSVVWVVYWRDGRKKWNEPLTIHRRQGWPGYWDLWNTEDPYQGYGEEFVSDYNADANGPIPDQQAARDSRDGMFLFHAQLVQES